MHGAYSCSKWSSASFCRSPERFCRQTARESVDILAECVVRSKDAVQWLFEDEDQEKRRYILSGGRQLGPQLQNSEYVRR